MLTDFENKIINKLGYLVHNNELSNECMVQIIELLGGYLNLKTTSEYSKTNNISYNGAKKCRKNLILFKIKFILDNDY